MMAINKKMSKAQHTTPQLRFPEFSGSWEKKKLGDIAKFSKGKGISKSDISENGILECIRYGELYTHYGERINHIISKTDADKSGLVLSHENDVIIPASGESQIDIAKASCVQIKGVALGGDLNIIRTPNDGLFLSYYLNSSKKNDIAKLAQGISVVHLYSSQLSLLNLNLPSLPEQTKIASFLTAVDDKLQVLKKKKEALERYKKGMMQKLFSQEIRFKDDHGNEFPDWEKKKLGELLKESKIKTTKNNQHEILSSTAKGLFSQKEYFNKEVASKDNVGYKVLRLNQLVFSPQNLWLGNINVNSLFEIGIVSPSYKIFDFTNCEIDFMRYSLFTNRMMHEYKQASEQGASVVRRNLDMDSFNSIPLHLPCDTEQTKIANFLSALDDKINQVEKQVQSMEQWKKGLLQKMFV
jgi:type I restriction enzyme S subunit